MTTTVTCSVFVRVSPDTAYHEWLDFDAFPHFDLEPVSLPPQWGREDEIHWMAGHNIRRALVTDRQPGSRIAWAVQEHDGRGVQAGIVTFTPTTERGTEVAVQLEYEPGDLLERLRVAVGTVDQQVQDVLDRFREQAEPAEHGARSESGDPIDELSDLADRPAADDQHWRGVGRRSNSGITDD